MAGPPQPNMALLSQALNQCSVEVAHIGNLPMKIQQTQQQIQQAQQQMQQQLQQVQQQLQVMQQAQQQQLQQVQQSIQILQQGQAGMLQTLQQCIQAQALVQQVSEARALARAANAATSQSIEPLPDAQNVMPQNFPATRYELTQLNDTGVNNLLGFYGLQVQGNIDARRQRLARFLAVVCTDVLNAEIATHVPTQPTAIILKKKCTIQESQHPRERAIMY